MMTRGVPAAASRPVNVVASHPGTPASPIVGISGSSATRAFDVTARARVFPDSHECDRGRELIEIDFDCPPAKSICAGPLPLYGTAISFVPVRL
jgi:hypothetical protein